MLVKEVLILLDVYIGDFEMVVGIIECCNDILSNWFDVFGLDILVLIDGLVDQFVDWQNMVGFQIEVGFGQQIWFISVFGFVGLVFGFDVVVLIV